MKNIYILIMTVFALGSCMQDNSNLVYQDILLPDSVFVTNVNSGVRLRYEMELAKVYSVNPGEELLLEAEVFYRGDDEITYEWYSGKKLISNEKNLRHLFTENADECMLLIGRRNAGNATCYHFNVTIRNTFGRGLVILAQDNNKTLLDYVENYSESTVVEFQGQMKTVKLNKYNLYEDVYANVNGGESLEGQEPVRLFRYGGFVGDEIFNGIQVVDKDWRKSVSINSTNMKKLVSMKDEFIEQPKNLQIADFTNIGYVTYLLAESGNIYTRVNYDYGNPSTGRFSTLALAYNDPYDVPDKGPGEIKADRLFYSNNIPNSKPIILAYEKDKKRFLILSAVTSSFIANGEDYSYITDFSRPKGGIGVFPPDYVDLNSFDKELISAFIPGTWKDEVYFLFRDGGACYMQCCKISGNISSIPFNVSNEAVKCEKVSADVMPLLSDGNNCFYGAKEKIYFSSGNKVYSMSYNGTNLKTEYSPQGATETSPITKFTIMLPWEEGTSSPINRYYGGRVLGIAFENGDFKVVKVYDDPDMPGEPQYKELIKKHYNGRVVDLWFYSL